MKTCIAAAIAASLSLAGCASSKPEVAADLTVALDVAAAAEGVYAAQPSADPQKVATLSRLLSVAQAAVASWQASSLPADQALASAAISALVEYEATGTPAS